MATIATITNEEEDSPVNVPHEVEKGGDIIAITEPVNITDHDNKNTVTKASSSNGEEACSVAATVIPIYAVEDDEVPSSPEDSAAASVTIEENLDTLPFIIGASAANGDVQQANDGNIIVEEGTNSITDDVGLVYSTQEPHGMDSMCGGLDPFMCLSKSASVSSLLDNVEDEGKATTEDEDDALADDGEDYMSLSEKAARFYAEDRLLDAARILRKIDSRLLTNKQKEMIRTGDEYQTFVDAVMSSDKNNVHWKKQPQQDVRGYLTDLSYSLSHNDNNGVKTEMKIATLMHKSLLSPLLAVLNEVDLYSSWLPHYRIPKVAISESVQLKQAGRVSQILRMKVDLQWPLDTRELILCGLACDDIESNGNIAIKLDTLDDDNTTDTEHPQWYPKKKGVQRVAFHGGFVFHPPTEEMLRQAHEKGDKYIKEGEDDSDYVVVSYLFYFENQGYLPETIIRFGINYGIVMAWGMTLKVAEEVRERKRVDFSTVIYEKRETLYDWVDERIAVMCASR